LVVVSNRVAPAKQPREGNQGGLAVAVMAALRETGGLWFGWNGKIKRHPESKPELVEGNRVTYRTISLSRTDYEQYYLGYSNRALWPLFHYRLDLSESNRRNFEGYLRVNRLFVTGLLPMLRSDDLIWIHDFHLIPMAEYLRNAGSDHRIGFFLHVPWPSVQVMLALPHHREIVRALCSYDVVGFQTETDRQAFCNYIRQEANGEVGKDGVVHAFGRTLIARAFPISIDTENVTNLAKAAVQARATEMLKESIGDRNLVIGVDRLDYTKGLIHRFEAVEHLLESYPEHRRNIVMLQIAPSTRSDVPEYKDLQHELEARAGHINGRFAEADRAPARYINKGYNRRTLCGFFRISRVGLVTPLRDGMNLVAKEFVAAQDPEDPGVLILSRFAGAAQELSGALVVNPYDVEGTGETLQQALAMPLEARRERWQADYDHLRRNDVSAWRKEYLSVLSRAPYRPREGAHRSLRRSGVGVRAVGRPPEPRPIG
jgi:trehalose 6-phosphate synthase